jgi:hypothetical protein
MLFQLDQGCGQSRHIQRQMVQTFSPPLNETTDRRIIRQRLK